MKRYVQIHSYIQISTLNLVETFKTSVHNTSHTQNTKLHFRISTSFKHLYISKIRHSRIEVVCLHYQQFQSFKYDTGTKVLMSKCFRPSNHLSRHAQTFPPGYRNLKDFYNRLRGSRFENSTPKNRHAWIRSLYIFEPPPHVKKQGLSNAQFRIEIAPEIFIQQPLFVLQMGYKIFVRSMFIFVVKYIHIVYIILLFSTLYTNDEN